MDIQGALQGISQSFQNYYGTTKQATMSAVLKLRDLRNDTEVFLKVGQIALATLHLIMMRYPEAAYLSRFSFALATANMHDFYRFLQQPRQWFFPVTAQAIDEHLVLKDLTKFIYRELKIDLDSDSEEGVISGSEDEIEESSDSEEIEIEKEEINERLKQLNDEDFRKLRHLLRDCLRAQLDKMDGNNDAYRSLDEFKEVIQKRLSKMRDADFNHYGFNDITLNDLKAVELSDLNEKTKDYHVAQWIRKVPLIERITNFNWAIVDIGCVGLYLQGWNLLDTAKWAEQIGQYPVFKWVQDHRLDVWVVGLVCTGFATKFFEAVRKLCDEKLTAQDKRQARWNVVTSAAELVLFGAIFLNQIGKTSFENANLQLLAIGAKSLGLLSIIVRPKHEFFQQPEAAPAA